MGHCGRINVEQLKHDRASGMTLAAIGGKYRISKQRVHQLIAPTPQERATWRANAMEFFVREYAETVRNDFAKAMRELSRDLQPIIDGSKEN